MSYFSGPNTMTVKPITRRLTLTRGQAPRMTKQYLQKPGRKPLNRIGYPTMGTPIAVDLSMTPGTFGRASGKSHADQQFEPGRREHDSASIMFEPGTFGHKMIIDGFERTHLGADWVHDPMLSVVDSRGRKVRTQYLNPFATVTLGRAGRKRLGRHILSDDYPAGYAPAPLDVIQNAIISTSAPMIPSVIAAPASAPSGGISGFASGIFDSAANFMKNISVSVDPLKTIQAVQQIIKPAQVGTLADQLRKFGINPAYLGIPVTGTTAQYGYQAAGINWMAYLPWVAGGAALLFVLPMVMGKRK